MKIRILCDFENMRGRAYEGSVSKVGVNWSQPDEEKG